MCQKVYLTSFLILEDLHIARNLSILNLIEISIDLVKPNPILILP
jgi:hypothetical protein